MDVGGWGGWDSGVCPSLHLTPGPTTPLPIHNNKQAALLPSSPPATPSSSSSTPSPVVEEVLLLTNRAGRPKGMAVVRLRTPELCQQALGTCTYPTVHVCAFSPSFHFIHFISFPIQHANTRACVRSGQGKIILHPHPSLCVLHTNTHTYTHGHAALPTTLTLTQSLLPPLSHTHAHSPPRQRPAAARPRGSGGQAL